MTAGTRAIGQGMQELGAEGSQAAQVWDRIKIERDETDAKRADVSAALTLNKRMRLDPDAFLNRRGANARDLTTAAATDFDTIKQEALKSLPSKRSREMFGQIFDQRAAKELTVISGHEVEQVRVDKIETAKAGAQSFAGLAVDSSNDPEAFRKILADGFSEYDTLATAEGWSPGRLKQMKADYVSSIHRRVAEKLRAGDPRAAEDWLNTNAAEISDSDETAIRETLVPGLEEAQYEDDMLAVDGAIKDAPPPPAETPAPSASGAAETPAATPAVAFKPAMITRRGTQGQTAAQHRARGSQNGVDIPAPMGDPVYPPIDGVVTQVIPDNGGDGGNQVIVRHPDGRVTGYAHLSKITVKVGDPVGQARPIGNVGSTGRSSGPHVHFTVRVNGEKVDPATQKFGGATGTGEPVTRYTAKLDNTQALYDTAHRLAVDQGWSTKRYERVLRGIDARANRNQALLADQERLASREAAEVIEKLGPGGLTSVKQMGEVFHRLPPSERVSYLALIAQNTAPKEPEFDPAFVLELSDQLATDPAGFAARDAAADLARLPKGSQMTYIGWRRSALGEGGKDGPAGKVPKQIDHSKIINVSKPLLDLAMPVSKSPNKKVAEQENAVRARRLLSFRTSMSEQLAEFERANNRPAGDDDIFKMASRLLTEVHYQDGSQAFAYERPHARGDVRIPAAEERRIQSDYLTRFGEAPTRAEVVRIWFDSGLGR